MPFANANIDATLTIEGAAADAKAVGDAIASIPNADWNQNDETQLDYVKNRPFYEKTDTVKIVLFDGDVQFNEEDMGPDMLVVIGSFDEPKEFENGKTYTVTIENEQQDIVCENNALIFVSSELNITFTFMEWDILLGIGEHDTWESSYYIKIETTEVSTTVKQLDEKFIPDTIARVEDIPEQVQSDWNQTDESAVDFIKNRTHYEKEEMTTRTCSFEYENIDSYEKITRGRTHLYYKISDDVYSRTTDVTLSVDYEGAEYSIPVPTCTDTAKYRYVTLKNGSTFIGACFIIYADAVTINYVNLTKGIWFNTYLSYINNGKTTYAHITESYSVTTIKLLDEKFIPDTIARVEDIPSTAIKPFPYYEVNELNANFTEYKVNLEELETNVLYSVQESPSTPYVAFALCIICDDGTEKIVTNIMDKTHVYYVNKTSKNITIYDAFNNSLDSINISDKSTSDNITVTSNLISRWLPMNNSIEYTPTGDYHPATKKYVDDTATTAANAIKNDLLNGAGEAYDTLKELGELIDDNVDAIEALEIIATGKANISDIPTKVSELTNDSGFITEAPQADWNQNDGTATNYIKNKPILATSEEIKALFN